MNVRELIEELQDYYPADTPVAIVSEGGDYSLEGVRSYTRPDGSIIVELIASVE